MPTPAPSIVERPVSTGPAIAPLRNRAMANRAAMREFFDPRTQWKAPVLRFETMDGRPAFVLDRSGPKPLFRYAWGGEVLVLREVHTTRGDILYKNDQGEVVLRRHRVGDATLFPQGRSRGIAAWATGAANSIAPQPVGVDTLRADLADTANHLARLLNQDMTISASGATSETAWIYDQAAQNFLASVRRVVRLAKPGPPLTQIHKISIVQGPIADSHLQNNKLTLYVDPAQGYAGRMSSLAMERVLLSDADRRETETLPLSEQVSDLKNAGGGSGISGGSSDRQNFAKP